MLLTQTGDPFATSISPEAATYLSIGQEIHNQDLTNYQNIPPANPDRTARPLLYALQQEAWNDMQSIIGALESFRTRNGHYPPGPEKGLPKTLKDYLTSLPPVAGTTVNTFEAMLWAHLQELKVSGAGFDDPNASFTDPWGNPYHYTTPTPANGALHGDYELVCYGRNNAPGPAPGDPLSEDITSWAEGLLAAQWFEYTPTSALDVSVDQTLPIGGPPLGG
jgi:hypothetical protein